MAYSALFSLIQSLDQILDPHDRYLNSILPYKSEITRLHEQASSLLALLEDSSPSEFDHSLEGLIRGVTYQAQDIIESHMSDHILSGIGSHGIIKSLRNRMSIFQTTITSLFHLRSHIPKLQHTVLRELIDRFESVLAIVSRIKNLNVVVEDTRVKKFASASSSRYESSNKITLVEIEDDLLKIKDLLTRSSSRLGIISIVGVGGIGKTTLARCIYDDPLIEEYFDIRAWTTVSCGYSLHKMLIDLLGSIGHFSVELGQESIAELEVKLHKSLKGRRYLIVMDDIWNNKPWNDVRRFFPDDNNGSRIILTTLLLEVAENADSSYIHHMRTLSFNGSWNLLSEKVFGETHCPPRLEELGKEIATNCKGHPLSIVVVGGLLSKVEKTPEFWKYVAENTMLAITGSDSCIKEILSLYGSLSRR